MVHLLTMFILIQREGYFKIQRIFVVLHTKTLKLRLPIIYHYLLEYFHCKYCVCILIVIICSYITVLRIVFAYYYYYLIQYHCVKKCCCNLSIHLYMDTILDYKKFYAFQYVFVVVMIQSFFLRYSCSK